LDEEEADEVQNNMDADLEIAQILDDEAIPYSIEYYLGVAKLEAKEHDEDEDGDEDSDESDEKPKPKKNRKNSDKKDEKVELG